MQRLEIGVIFLLALVLLSVAGMWLKTEWSHHDQALLVDRMLNKKSLDTGALEKVLQDFKDPSKDILPGEHLFYRSTLAVAAADLPGLSESIRLQWLDQARTTLPRVLAREPAHTNAWVHLAYTEWLSKGANPKSVDALRMSIHTSPADRQILLWRLKLAGLNRNFWDNGFKDLILGQAAMAWQYAPHSLAEIAQTYHVDDLVKQVLADDPAEVVRFEKLAGRQPML